MTDHAGDLALEAAVEARVTADAALGQLARDAGAAWLDLDSALDAAQIALGATIYAARRAAAAGAPEVAYAVAASLVRAAGEQAAALEADEQADALEAGE